MTHREQLQEVRELLERHWTALEIAHKMCIREQQALQLIQQLKH